MGAFTASAWRGALGHALRRASCRTGEPTCEGCPHKPDCDYSLIFETPALPGASVSGPDTLPHPFALTAVLDSMGEPQVTLALFGSGSRFLPPLLSALQIAARGGIGPDRVSCRLESVECEHPLGSGHWSNLHAVTGPITPVQPPPAPDACQLRLLTPLRLRRRGNYLGPSDFHFADLMDSLTQRIQSLCALYSEPLQVDFKSLAALAAATPLTEPNLRWHDWSRFSSRQQCPIAMGGILGSFSVSLAAVPALWPFLWIGQFTQAGKGTSLGLGQYQIEIPPCAN